VRFCGGGSSGGLRRVRTREEGVRVAVVCHGCTLVAIYIQVRPGPAVAGEAY
jgi:broad specificity phosphatase PhoE